MKRGLNDKEVEKSRIKYGQNIIEEAKPETFLNKFLDAFKDPMIMLLIVIAVILGGMAAIGHASWSELVGIGISILIVTFISAKTEVASDNEYRKLKNSAEKEKCKVYRNGQAIEIIVDDIVVGDCIILESGDKIPADGILIDGELKVDNSALNGEAEECRKTASIDNNIMYEEEVAITGDTFVDKSSLFRGAVVYSGYGLMRVKKIGMNTVMGSMAKDMTSKEVDSPLKVKLKDLAGKISKFGYIGAVVIAVILISQRVITAGGINAYFDLGAMYIIKDLLETLMLSVTIIVMAVPEGLPLMIAIVLMRNTSKMLQNNVLVRKPIGIETAGSLNVLFSDKTGTITKGKLEVVEFFDGNIEDSYNESKVIKEFLMLLKK